MCSSKPSVGFPDFRGGLKVITSIRNLVKLTRRFGEGFCSEVEICANWKSFLGFLELYLLSYMKKFICHEYLIDVCII